MFKKEPEGYRKLLVYQKASILHEDILKLTIQFPRVKKFFELEDQMNRSGRSGPKNVAEGWKRNTTKEYFDFLGFAIASVDEVMGDAADIILGKYPELMGIKGVTGGKGLMGEKGGKGLMTREQLDTLKFYPLDTSLLPVVQVFLRAKEVGYLIYRLQQSLDVKMDADGSKPMKDKFRERLEQEREADKSIEQMFKDLGMVRLPNGQYIAKGKGVEGEDRGSND